MTVASSWMRVVRRIGVLLSTLGALVSGARRCVGGIFLAVFVVVGFCVVAYDIDAWKQTRGKNWSPKESGPRASSPDKEWHTAPGLPLTTKAKKTDQGRSPRPEPKHRTPYLAPDPHAQRTPVGTDLWFHRGEGRQLVSRTSKPNTSPEHPPCKRPQRKRRSKTSLDQRRRGAGNAAHLHRRQFKEPHRHGGRPAPTLQTWLTDWQEKATTLSEDDLHRIMTSLPRNGAADMAGRYGEDIQLLLNTRIGVSQDSCCQHSSMCPQAFGTGELSEWMRLV